MVDKQTISCDCLSAPRHVASGGRKSRCKQSLSAGGFRVSRLPDLAGNGADVPRAARSYGIYDVLVMGPVV